MSVPVAHVVRSGFVEGVHYGSAVVTDADGSVLWSVGDVASHMFPRSSNKLMQGLAMVRAGLPLKNELLALACASHSGESFHLEGVRSILNAASMDVDSLQCPLDYPLDDVERDTALAAGIDKQRIFMNCSGKHAAMLFTCVLNGWDTMSYREVNHPLQLAIKNVIEEMTEDTVEHVGTDGCGAPLMSTSLISLARVFGKFAGPHADSNQRAIADAIRANPEYLGGTRRDVTSLMQGFSGLLAKDGAEGVYGIGLSDGRALALKIDDGADRARIVVAAEILNKVLGIEAPVIHELLDGQILRGAGQPVGKIVPAFSA